MNKKQSIIKFNPLDFISKKGNRIQIIGVHSTGFRLNQVEYTIIVNGKLQDIKPNYSQIKVMANGNF